jgi:hypothetical protein
MKQTILFLRNGSLYANREEAIEGLNSVTHKPGQPVIALYGITGAVELIFAIGTEEGKYKIIQEGLASGLNIKTINNISILGSGNLEVGNIITEDIGEEIDDSSIISVTHNKSLELITGNIIEIYPNIYYRKTDIVSSLVIKLIPEVDSTILNEYFIEFTTAVNGTSVTLPDSVKWINGQIPVFENNQTYQISIINNLGICSKFS